jgi:chromosome segregation ATPase
MPPLELHDFLERITRVEAAVAAAKEQSRESHDDIWEEIDRIKGDIKEHLSDLRAAMERLSNDVSGLKQSHADIRMVKKTLVAVGGLLAGMVALLAYIAQIVQAFQLSR